MKLALIVDDEPLDREVASQALDRAGIGTLEADNYESAVRVFQENQDAIDLLLVDVSLPAKNGVELAKELVRLKPALRLLFVSGHVGSEVIRFYGMNTSDAHFLQKPFPVETLLDRVREILKSTGPVPWAVPDQDEKSNSASK
ncbi:MAG: hypothetical protein C5B51_05225 [Terriglobia bacterium]|nr:MAG: hypothetical protein C5B51_05225 [Terriglobia bacterium]